MIRLQEIRLLENKVAEQYWHVWVEKKVCLKLSRHKHATRYADSAARLIISNRPELLPSQKKAHQ